MCPALSHKITATILVSFTIHNVYMVNMFSYASSYIQIDNFIKIKRYTMYFC